jgi:hypothetical protein
MWNSSSNQNFCLWYKLRFGFWLAVSDWWLQFGQVITGLLEIRAVTQKELWHYCWSSRKLFYYMRLWCCGILDKWQQWPIAIFSWRLVMCDVEDSESTGDGGKFLYMLILMCDYRNLLVLLLLSKFCLSVAFQSHTHTQMHCSPKCWNLPRSAIWGFGTPHYKALFFIYIFIYCLHSMDL